MVCKPSDESICEMKRPENLTVPGRVQSRAGVANVGILRNDGDDERSG